jgi:hypothetical protein
MLVYVKRSDELQPVTSVANVTILLMSISNHEPFYSSHFFSTEKRYFLIRLLKDAYDFLNCFLVFKMQMALYEIIPAEKN